MLLLAVDEAVELEGGLDVVEEGVVVVKGALHVLLAEEDVIVVLDVVVELVLLEVDVEARRLWTRNTLMKS